MQQVSNVWRQQLQTVLCFIDLFIHKAKCSCCFEFGVYFSVYGKVPQWGGVGGSFREEALFGVVVVTGAKEEDSSGGDGDVGKGVGHDVATVTETCMWGYDGSCFLLLFSGGVGGGVLSFLEPLIHFLS